MSDTKLTEEQKKYIKKLNSPWTFFIEELVRWCVYAVLFVLVVLYPLVLVFGLLRSCGQAIGR